MTRGAEDLRVAVSGGLVSAAGGRLASVVDAITLLEDGWVFSQSSPMDTKGFVDAAESRGFRLSEDHLAALCGLGILPPLLAIHEAPVRPPIASTPGPSLAGRSTLRTELAVAAREGRLTDPTVERLPADWDSSSRYRLDDGTWWWNGLMYGRWQLLEFAGLGRYFSKAGWPLLDAWATLSSDDMKRLSQRARRTTLLLTALEARYLPQLDENWLHLTNATFEEWEAYRGGSASALEVRLATTPQEIEQMADRLLFEAYRIDPLSAWCRVVRHGSPRAQESLRGDALLALDLLTCTG